ncbi:MAG: long-chain fatty acid--CoA ligase [Candidatus Dadabacteria bacterium]|nr:MAG: long-chain fatty acid--CoA ligase [Candidatus Dadabacteria bacterium]
MSENFDSFNSLAEAFYNAAEKYPEREVYSQAIIDAEDSPDRPRSWRSVNFQSVKNTVDSVGLYLKKIGLERGDKVAILSATRPEWMEADLAILACGGVSVSVYQSLPAEDVGYILFDSESRVVFAENQEQVDKLIWLLNNNCPIAATEEREATEARIDLLKIISFEQAGGDERVVCWKDILAEYAGNKGFVWEEDLRRDDLAALVYTSGTTGPPKGVMQTHGNHLANVRQAFQCSLVDDPDSIMLFLPLAHSFAKLMGYIGFLSPVRLKFPGIPDRTNSKLNPDSTTKDIREGSARIVPVVPRLLEKMQSGVLAKTQGGGLAGRLLGASINAAQAVYAARNGTGRARLIDKGVYTLTAGLRKKIKEKLFGPHFRYCISGGAKLSPDVARFFDALGIEILEGYGLTETCVATNVNRLGRKKIGTVGPVLAPDIEMRIASDGEILFRGPNVAMGYYKREKATRAAWDSSGWFHTGDLGSVDQDGYLTIEGRKKEIIVTSYGKKIAPEIVEEKFKSSPYISQVVIYGDDRQYCVLLVTLLPDVIKDWAAKNGISLQDKLEEDPAVKELIGNEIEKVNRTLASFETAKKFAILSEDFTVENGLLTPTFKVKRKAVVKKYRDLIDSLYQE